MSTWAILAAAGAGRRAGGELPKQFWELHGVPVMVRAARALLGCAAIDGLVVVAPAEHLERARALLDGHELSRVRVVAGGPTRAESVKIGLDALPPSCTVVAVHDAARPFVQSPWIEKVVEAAERHGAALLATTVSDTIKRVEQGDLICTETVPRQGLYLAQTPQAFQRSMLVEAYARAGDAARDATDEAALVESQGHHPVIVEGDRRNLKLTGPEDRELAVALAAVLDREGEPALENSGTISRVGTGFDAHRFDSGRPLILGGVRFREQDGLLGHSDADVLTHAVADALLGAINAGDLGQVFPDSDPRFADARSLDLLREVAGMAAKQGMSVLHLDATLLAEEPRVGPRRAEICENLAQALGVEVSRVSVKATTTEGMGFVGRREGIAAIATVLVAEQNRKQDRP